MITRNRSVLFDYFYFDIKEGRKFYFKNTLYRQAFGDIYQKFTQEFASVLVLFLTGDLSCSVVQIQGQSLFAEL